jgi:YVTN family beta-propeller protein
LAHDGKRRALTLCYGHSSMSRRDGRLAARVGLLVALTGCAATGHAPPSAHPLPSSAVLATIPVGTPPTLLAISPDGSRVFAASSGELTIIDAASNTAARTVRIPPYTTGVAVTPYGTRVLINSVSAARLVVVDGVRGVQLSPIGLPLDVPPGGFGRIAVTADDRHAYVTNQAKEYLALVDLKAATVRERSLDLRPSDVTLSNDGGTLYVTGCKDFCTTGTVQVLDTATLVNARSFAVGPGPYRFALSPDGTRGYTTNLGGPSLSVVDVASGATLATVPVGVEPTGLAVTPDGTHVWVANQQQGTLTIVDARANTVGATASMPSQPREIVFAPDGRRAYVSVRNAVLVLDATQVAGH